MKLPTATAQATPDAETQLIAFIAKFDPKDQRLIRAVRNALRQWFATANELVYDNSTSSSSATRLPSGPRMPLFRWPPAPTE